MSCDFVTIGATMNFADFKVVRQKSKPFNFMSEVSLEIKGVVIVEVEIVSELLKILQVLKFMFSLEF